MIRENPNERLSSAHILKEFEKIYPNYDDQVPSPSLRFRLHDDEKSYKVCYKGIPVELNEM